MPDVVNTLGFALACLLICAHYATKILDWLQKKKYLTYSSNSAEFIADMYKIKMKWVKRGEFMYARALDTVIGAEMMPNADQQPQTEEGRQYIEKMKEVMADEARKNADVL